MEQEQKWNDPMYQEMYQKTETKEMLRVYGISFAFVIFGLFPWAVGACMLVKWILF